MHISLTPELESRVKAKVESGLSNNASEVIHEAWIGEIKLACLREQINQGLAQLDQRQGGTEIESRESLDRLYTAIMAVG